MEPALARLALARLALSCLDLTSLKANDTDASIEALAAQAMTPHGAPAALCVYPPFVPVAKRARVATVVNFPHGTST